MTFTRVRSLLDIRSDMTEIQHELEVQEGILVKLRVVLCHMCATCWTESRKLTERFVAPGAVQSSQKLFCLPRVMPSVTICMRVVVGGLGLRGEETADLLDEVRALRHI